MRNFEGRKAEIFRRSEARIKARKKKRVRAVLSCVPLFICIMLYVAVKLPSIVPNLNKHESAVGVIPGNESIGCSDIQVEVTAQEGEYYRQYTDQDVIADMSDAIHAITGKDETDSDKVLPEYSIENEVQGESKDEEYDSMKMPGYRINFTGGNGSVAEYILSDRTLYDNINCQKFLLTEEQWDVLRVIFRLTDE